MFNFSRRFMGAPAAPKLGTQVFMDISINGAAPSRVVFELFNKHLPKTARNFESLCVGDQGLSYKGSKFHRAIPGFIV